MKHNKPKLSKYIKVYYDKKFTCLSNKQLELKYNISITRMYQKVNQLEKKYPDIYKILSYFKRSELENKITMESIIKRLKK